MAQVKITGVVSHINLNLNILSKDGEILAVMPNDCTKKELNRRLEALAQYEPKAVEMPSSYLIGGTKFLRDGKSVNWPQECLTEIKGQTYQPSLRIPVAEAGAELGVGDSVEIETTDEDLRAETETVFRGKNLKLRKQAKAKTLKDYLAG